ncbi:MAG TPA: metallophosphoesterase [Methylomirabilota bacterium]|nr:metallophosphoesterase [Methylomirabilota bacterium]
MDTKRATVRVAAIGDLHYTRASHGSLQPLAAQITHSADLLLLCGDIIDYGLPEEARLFAKELTSSTIMNMNRAGRRRCRESLLTPAFSCLMAKRGKSMA